MSEVADYNYLHFSRYNAASPHSHGGEGLFSFGESMMMDQTGPTTLDNQVGLGFDHVVIETALGSRTHKNKNEDSYWPRQNAILLQPHATIDYLIMGRLYIVADGVSGGLAGHEASELAVQTIAEQYYGTLFQFIHPPTEYEIQHALKEAILRASNMLLERSHERMTEHAHKEERMLQSAVLCVLVRGKQAIVANVGDCHLYRYRSGEVDLLSVADHSTAYFLGSPLQHHQIALYQVTLSAQDVLILCSDGLYRYLSPDNDPRKAPGAMRQIFHRDYHSHDIKQVANRLLEQANEPAYGGGRDNITVMLIECAPSEDSLTKRLATEQALEELIEQVWWIENRSDPLLTHLGQQVQQVAQEKEGAEQALWQRRAAQLGASIGQPEWAQAQALSYQLGFDFEENYSLVQQIWHLHDQAPSHPQLAKLAFEAVVDLANTALLSTDVNKERMLSSALTLLLPLRETLFKQIKQIGPDDASYGEEVLLQLQTELSRATYDVLPSAVLKGTRLRLQRLLWLMISSLLFLLCLWIFL